MFVRNCWYVAAWNHELVNGRLLSRKLLNESILFYRKENGEVAALADRCCHRLAPLSLGRQEGDCIRCMYHGLKFDPKGACVEAPGQPRIPPNAKVRAYPVVEKNRWIWIWMGDPEKADPALIADTYPLQHEDWALKPGYLHYQANYLLITDNLLDFSHLAYVHPTTLGGSEDIASVRPKIEKLERGVRITRWHLNEVPAPFHRHAGKFSGKVDRWYIYDFLVPGLFLMHSGVQETGTGAPEGKIENALEFRSCHAVTPETDLTSHYFWAVPHNFSTSNPIVTESVYQNALKAFDEDRVIIEAQQRVVNDSPDTPMMNLGVDAALVQFRSVVSQMIAAESGQAVMKPRTSVESGTA